MACSTPVVATGTGGSGEFLVDGLNCLRMDVDDHRGLAAAVIRLSEDPSLRAAIIEGGLRTAAELTMPRWAGILARWHEAAAVGGPAPAHRQPISEILREP
jgi:glycosyltransferase involved in cell wall biosynthesis